MTPGTENALLEARAQRAHHVKALSMDFEDPVVLIKPNIPGKEKNASVARIVLNCATRLMRSLVHVVHEAQVFSQDGTYHVMIINKEKEALKRLCVYLEDTHRLGRLFDLDVHVGGRKLSRVEFGHDERACMVCGGTVDVCRREGRHRMSTLLSHIHTVVHRYLLDALSEEAAQALRKELYMDPCFALVGPRNSGRHTDMNFSHFLASIEALKPYFRLYGSYGSDLSHTLYTLRRAGEQGEAAMLKATGGINTHKGAHFIFGLVLPVFMHCILHNATFEAFQTTLSDTAAYVLKEDFKRITPSKATTRGEKLYAREGIKGVRGEALNGFPSIFDWYPHEDSSDLEALMRIIGRLDDTTLYRDGLDPKAIKKAFKAAEADGFEDKDTLYDTYRHVSPGGAADMLALVYFLRQTDHLLKSAP